MKVSENLIFPLLEESSGRDREIKQFGIKKVEEVIYHHLFLNKDHRQLDKELLGKIDGTTKGRISANILYYYGIKGKNNKNRAIYRGIFHGISLLDAVEYLENLIVQKPSRRDIVNIIKILNHLKNSLDREEGDKDYSYLEEIDEYLKEVLKDNVEKTINIVDQVKQPNFSENILDKKSGYRRNPKVATESILVADFKCEVSEDHITFISKKYNKPYMEAHHIVPMKFQYKFPNTSLDTHANIVAICPNCHRLIHHATELEYERILDLLLNKRITRLSNCGIDIDINTLLLMYKE